jgi:predicted nucleotidyltransferase
MQEDAYLRGFLHGRARRLSTICPQRNSRKSLIRDHPSRWNFAALESIMSARIAPRRDEILQALRDAKPLLDTFGVGKLSLFGSFARDEAREDSDVDLLVEFNRPTGLFEFVRLQRELGTHIGRPIELVTPAALKPQLRDRILSEAVVAA